MKVLLFANTAWYLFNFRLSLARELRARGFEVLLVSPPDAYGERLRALGFAWEPLPMNRRSLNPVRELGLLRQIARLYARERPDLAHHFTIKCVVYGGIAAALAKVPARVNAVAGMGYVFTSEAAKARLLRPVVRRLMRAVLGSPRSRLILQNSDDVADFESARLADAERIRLIKGSGVDTSRFQPAERPVLAGPEVRVLLAARLLWDKGIGEYVQAARALRAQGLPLRFLLAGSPDPGNPAAIPQAQLDAWAAEGVVEILGQVEDMASLLKTVDIAVLASYREGLPKGLIEAAAFGLPLVTTDVPGCREVVHHERDGLIVPARDAGALAAAIRRLCERPEWARELGKNARARALAEFDETIVIAATLGVYEELLPGGLPANEDAGHPDGQKARVAARREAPLVI
jgi:glycosyltransferase involved in cell wall biosynthesis